MKQKLAWILNSTSGAVTSEDRQRLLFQRLFWGAFLGCLMAVFFGDSSSLEGLELRMLEWRYKMSAEFSPGRSRQSSDLYLVAFDNNTQFDFSTARFDDQRSQELLAQVIENLEAGKPALIAVDLDLRGATNEHLVDVLKRYRNVVIALSGSMDSHEGIPSPEFLDHAASYGYSHVTKEYTGLVCQLPVNREAASLNSGSSTSFLIPSFAEAVVDVHRRVKGVGPSIASLSNKAGEPVYINFGKEKFPQVSMAEVLAPEFDSSKFADKVVIIGNDLYSRRDDPNRYKTPLNDSMSPLMVQAEAVATLLNNDAIYSAGNVFTRQLTILLGAVLGALAAVLPLGLRTAFVLTASMLWVAVCQLAFQMLHVALPVVPVLTVIATSFVLGTVIFLDTDLRQRNKELAQARESMQVRAEEERRRIAEDLHDETLPALSAVARMTDKLVLAEEEGQLASQMREKLDHAVMEMRRVINDLHPSVMETMGFVPALENLLAILSAETDIEGKFSNISGQEDYALPMFTKLQLYRIVQESLNNVRKHSQATQVELVVESEAHQLTISIADNGRGMDQSSLNKPRSLTSSHGLNNIKQRAQLIGARVIWRRSSQFNRGTEVRVKIALIENGKEQV